MSEPGPHRFCLDCGYPLDHLRRHICPECGRAFDPDDLETFFFSAGPLERLPYNLDNTMMQLLAADLASHGVRAVLLGGMLGAAAGGLPPGPHISESLWVGRDQFEQACTIVEQVLNNTEGPGPPWVCPSCGESVEGQFDLCWNCGAPRPEDADPA